MGEMVWVQVETLKKINENSPIQIGSRCLLNSDAGKSWYHSFPESETQKMTSSFFARIAFLMINFSFSKAILQKG